MTSINTNRVRELNDEFRTTAFSPLTAIFSPLGQCVFTRGIYDLGPAFIVLAIGHIMGFNAFTEDNDPHGEHDFGSFTIAGETVFWKIDYYDSSLESGSEDPADATITSRVMTIMLASEY